MNAWRTQRKSELPRDWPRIRRIVLERDGYRCTWPLADGSRCAMPANQVDHVGDKHDHDVCNLRSLCEYHHSRRTSAQGNAARTRVTQQRPREAHPGIIG